MKKKSLRESKKEITTLIKESKRLYNENEKTKKKADRVPFEKTKDFKRLNKRLNDRIYYYKNREIILGQKKYIRQKIKIVLQKGPNLDKVNYVEIARGPVFQVLAYNDKARNAIMFFHIDKLLNNRDFYGVIQVDRSRVIYRETVKYFDGVRFLIEQAREFNSSAYCIILEASSPNFLVQYIKVFLNENDADENEETDE